MDKRPLNLLLADDDVDDRYFFELSLSKIAIPTALTTATNGVELMDLLLDTKEPLPDLIFLDLNMPLKSGFECLTEIMRNEKLKDLPIIVYSTSMDDQILESLYTNGAFHFICKPNEYSKLKDLILEGINSLRRNVERPCKESFVIEAK